MTQRDPVLLELALGARSALDRWERVLARHVPDEAALAGGEPTLDERAAAGVDIVLGAIALAGRLRAALEATPEPPLAPPGPQPADLTAECLLR